MTAKLAVWGIALLATVGVILRPMKIAEPVWALGGAAVLAGWAASAAPRE